MKKGIVSVIVFMGVLFGFSNLFAEDTDLFNEMLYESKADSSREDMRVAQAEMNEPLGLSIFFKKASELLYGILNENNGDNSPDDMELAQANSENAGSDSRSAGSLVALSDLFAEMLYESNTGDSQSGQGSQSSKIAALNISKTNDRLVIQKDMRLALSDITGPGESSVSDASLTDLPTEILHQDMGSSLEEMNLAQVDMDSVGELSASEGSSDESTVADPIQSFNRAMYGFNDKLYFWVLKPVAQGYSYLVPESARVGVRRFFSNISTPIRLINSLLQFKFEKAGVELSRFVINSTIGIAGLMDIARDQFDLHKQKEDFDQTLGVMGFAPGFHIHWPIFGPSSLRGTVGLIGDFLMDPVTYVGIFYSRPVALGINTYERVNDASLDIGIYEDIKKDALDPYIFIRDDYQQNRESLIKE